MTAIIVPLSQYLIQFGFKPQEVVRISKYGHIQHGLNAAPVTTLFTAFQQFGFTKTDIINLTLKYPNLLQIHPDTVSDVFTFLRQFGFSQPDLIRLAAKYPQVLNIKVTSVTKLLDLLQKYGFRVKQVIKILMMQPLIFGVSDVDADERIVGMLVLFSNIDVVIDLICSYPAVLTSDPITVLNRFINIQQRTGYSDEKARTLVITCPALLGYSRYRVIEHMDFLDHVKIPYDKHYRIYLKNPRTIRGRHVILHRLRRQADLKLHLTTDAHFENETNHDQARVEQSDPGSVAQLP